MSNKIDLDKAFPPEQNKPKWEKEKLKEFFGFNDIDRSYVYILGRVKEAFQIGTIKIDDFKELTSDDDFYFELEKFISDQIQKARIETLKECLPDYKELGQVEVLDETDTEWRKEGWNDCRQEILTNAKEKFGIEIK